MEVGYYLDISGICPVKEYLRIFQIHPKDTVRTRTQKIRKLAEIDAKIETVAAKGGGPLGNIATILQSYGVMQIRQGKDAVTLIRILYFCHQGRMILLHAFEKPRVYSGKKDERGVAQEMEKGSLYKERFRKNPNNYEEYEES